MPLPNPPSPFWFSGFECSVTQGVLLLETKSKFTAVAEHLRCLNGVIHTRLCHFWFHFRVWNISKAASFKNLPDSQIQQRDLVLSCPGLLQRNNLGQRQSRAQEHKADSINVLSPGSLDELSKCNTNQGIPYCQVRKPPIWGFNFTGVVHWSFFPSLVLDSRYLNSKCLPQTTMLKFLFLFWYLF